ncbi:unnamed protein product [Cuscuta campestris]|uniref:C2H2-type domain-containing protein n=1 Tax=Cuscuta campestris TaxID=132261 RepID=A0A484KKL0_9ASTE|nr:unnamed protein product [Cuscuta campestris]
MNGLITHQTSSSIPPLPAAGSNPTPPPKKKRNPPGNPDPGAEVVALSPKSLMATNRFVCDVCGKGFQRDQNLQLHRRGHNLPWKLMRQRGGGGGGGRRKRAYVCPEKSCVHHSPSRALGDLTGIKKHYCRKHGEKKWGCAKCSKRYAVQSDWKAHSKTCGTRDYKCGCGTLFTRKDSFTTHRAFCDALAKETARLSAASNMQSAAAAVALSGGLNCRHHIMAVPVGQGPPPPHNDYTNMMMMNSIRQSAGLLPPLWMDPTTSQAQEIQSFGFLPSLFSMSPSANMSATAMLQKAAQTGPTTTSDLSLLGLKCDNNNNNNCLPIIDQFQIYPSSRRYIMQNEVVTGGQTRDFLGVGVQSMCNVPSSLNRWI